MRTTLAACSVLVLCLLGTTRAFAGANRIPEWSMDTDQDVKKSIQTFGFTTEGKAVAWPKKIAIPSFVIRYDKDEYDKDDEVRHALKFADDASYTALTDQLYDAIVKRFTDAGFEVVPREAVVRAPSYVAMTGESGGDEGAERVRALPSGMKDLGTKLGQPSHPNALAALNRELGTDAVVAIYANFGLCVVDATLKTPFSGTKPCLRGNLTFPGLSMMFIGGAKGEGAATKPEWTSRAYKSVVEFTYQDGTGTHMTSGGPVGDVPDVRDAALISPLDARDRSPDRIWTGISGGDGFALAQGMDDMLDVAFTLAMETFYDKNADVMAAAKFPRPKLSPPHESAKLLTPEQVAAKSAAAAAKFEETKAAFATRAEGAPQVGGSVTCFRNAAVGNRPEVVMRRGMEPGRLVEESVSVVAVIGPVQNVATYTIGAGTYEAVDSKGAWTGTGTFEGPPEAWTAWKSLLKVKTGATVEVTGSTEGAGLHILTVVKGADGAVAMSMDDHYTAMDLPACDAAWAAALAYKAPPLPVPGAKKPKKGQ